jgi:hypothetical protein
MIDHGIKEGLTFDDVLLIPSLSDMNQVAHTNSQCCYGYGN